MDAQKRFGKRLKEWRKRRELSQAVLGEAIGSDGPRVHRLEKGTENATLETLEKIATALRIDVSELLMPRPREQGHGESSGGATLADTLRGAVAEFEKTGLYPNDWRGDIMLAVFALTRALQRPGSIAENTDRPAAANE